MSEDEDRIIADRMRAVRALEKLIHGFDLDEGSKSLSQLPVQVELSGGRVGFERPWGYYTALAERIYQTIEMFDDGSAELPTTESSPTGRDGK